MNLSVKQKQTDTESRFGAAAGEGKRGEISIISDTQILPIWKEVKRN